MACSELGETIINLRSLMNDAKCYETMRQLRWPEGRCTADERYFDDLTGTPSLPVTISRLCSYFMGLNLSNQQIAQELGLK